MVLIKAVYWPQLIRIIMVSISASQMVCAGNNFVRNIADLQVNLGLVEYAETTEFVTVSSNIIKETRYVFLTPLNSTYQ